VSIKPTPTRRDTTFTQCDKCHDEFSKNDERHEKQSPLNHSRQGMEKGNEYFTRTISLAILKVLKQAASLFWSATCRPGVDEHLVVTRRCDSRGLTSRFCRAGCACHPKAMNYSGWYPAVMARYGL